MLGEKPFTVGGLALRWSISEWTIYEMLNDGRLRGFRLGTRMWRIAAEEVARYESAASEPGPKANTMKSAELRLIATRFSKK
jgi:excisionase family DNA binding protein